MSTFITSDYNILAIVKGMRKRQMLSYRDRGYMAEALRMVNEHITWNQWRKDGCLPLGLEVSEDEILKAFSSEDEAAHSMELWELRELAWELMKENSHKKVKWIKDRDFTDEEIWESCKCWLYQVETELPISFDYITIIASVKQLKQALEQSHLGDGTWKRKVYFGTPHFFTQNAEDGTWNDIDKQVKWNLAA